ncbi:succinate dehydrogenase cytochrome b subunit [Schaalia suimastitidis]|uniref:succinate dehydrogenase cytochrome b subunit n=1 Tax=Schaalia suimastitidis TaxID=121163 RepID=UPI0004002251|nr:succinate dehydrogenase cytochrome b subunit [Schaalia suimastitidis]
MEVHGQQEVQKQKKRLPSWVAKSLMGATGLIMSAFVLIHMIGNLKLLMDPADLDYYAQWLRELLVPLLPYEGFLWLFRIVMTVALATHVLCAWSLWRQGRATKTPGTRKRAFQGRVASMMLPTGLILLLFLAIHLADLTLGVIVASESFQHPNPAFHVAANVIASLSRPLVAITYLVALAALALHIAHGLPQAWQDLGGTSRRSRRLIHVVSGIIALTILIGNGVVIVYALIVGGN